MLGGSVYIALIRYVISLTGTIVLFSLISEPRYDKKKTVICYISFGIVLIACACIWYVIDWSTWMKMSAFVMYLCFSAFAILMSSDPIYLLLYKLALIYYLLAVFLIGGIEVSMIFFDRNVWADIITRIILILFMAVFIDKKIKESIRRFGHYVETELDKFSIFIMI